VACRGLSLFLPRRFFPNGPTAVFFFLLGTWPRTLSSLSFFDSLTQSPLPRAVPPVLCKTQSSLALLGSLSNLLVFTPPLSCVFPFPFVRSRFFSLLGLLRLLHHEPAHRFFAPSTVLFFPCFFYLVPAMSATSSLHLASPPVFLPHRDSLWPGPLALVLPCRGISFLMVFEPFSRPLCGFHPFAALSPPPASFPFFFSQP